MNTIRRAARRDRSRDDRRERLTRQINWSRRSSTGQKPPIMTAMNLIVGSAN